MRTADLLSSSSPLPKDVWIENLLLTGNNHATLASTTSDDSLRTLDATTLQLVGGVTRVHDGVTCLKPFDADQACVLTAGRDAVVRCWDLRSGKAELEVGNGYPLSLLEATSNLQRKLNKLLNYKRNNTTIHLSRCPWPQYSRGNRIRKFSSDYLDLVCTSWTISSTAVRADD